MESKPITTPQSGTTPSQPKPIESKPVTTSHVSTPQKQVEVKPERFNVFLIIVPVEIMEQAIVTLVKK
ncbi:Isocitrate dehydrogenase [Bacillus mycoides]|nr:Isocitrate dehydrogenase [Bacillus mycoides]